MFNQLKNYLKMGTVKSTIYATNAKDPMTQLNFVTDFQEQSTNVTIDLLQSGQKAQSKTYNVGISKPIAEISLKGDKISAIGTITYATDGNAIVFSGNCIWEDVTSFLVENVAVAYR